MVKRSDILVGAGCACLVGAAGCFIAAKVLDMKSEKALIAGLAMANKVIDKYDEVIFNRTQNAELVADIHNEVRQHALEDIHEECQDADRLDCFEPYTKTYFSMTQVELLKAEIEVNKLLTNTQHVWLDDWIDILGIHNPKDRSMLGHKYGWFIDDTFNWTAAFMGYYLEMVNSFDERGIRIVGFTISAYEPDEPDEWGFDDTHTFP